LMVNKSHVIAIPLKIQFLTSLFVTYQSQNDPKWKGDTMKVLKNLYKLEDFQVYFNDQAAIDG
jgi:hypothetical protein